MKTKKKAVGYVCAIPVPGAGEVISKEDQRLRIMKYAKRENVELVCIYEDDEYSEDFKTRPGVSKVRDCRELIDMVLVERVWSLSRKRKELEPFLKELDEKNVQLVASSYLWDCVSQQIRHRYSGDLSLKLKAEAQARATAKADRNAA